MLPRGVMTEAVVSLPFSHVVLNRARRITKHALRFDTYLGICTSAQRGVTVPLVVGGNIRF